MESPTRVPAREAPGLVVKVEGQKRQLPPVDVEPPLTANPSLAEKKAEAQAQVQRLRRGA